MLEDSCVMNWGIDTRCLIFNILLPLLLFLCLKHNALFSRIVLHFAFPSLGPDSTNVEKEASLWKPQGIQAIILFQLLLLNLNPQLASFWRKFCKPILIYCLQLLISNLRAFKLIKIPRGKKLLRLRISFPSKYCALYS